MPKESKHDQATVQHPINRRKFLRLAAIAGGGLALPSFLGGCGPVDSETQLAMKYYSIALRNRPCYLYSFHKDGETHETYAPCSWEWFYQKAGISTPLSVLDTSDVRKRDFDQGQVIGLADEYQMGQSWDDALYGAGSYCHVEPIGEYFGKGLYNLEYWTLFAFNKVESVPSRDHKADVICVQMVYNEYLNWITRISFSIHGNAIVAFDVPTPDEFQKCCGALTAYFEKITGSDGYKIMAGVDSKQRPLTKKVKPWPSKRHYASGPTFLWDGVSFDYPDNYFYFAESEDGTGEGYVHPCVFLENGSHEPWPNETGSYTAVGDHEGGSYCFIPKDISLLFPYKNQENKNEPFMYFGGKFGSSDGPKGLQLHKAWLNPEQNVDLAGRDDMDPYSLGNDMEFPPT